MILGLVGEELNNCNRKTIARAKNIVIPSHSVCDGLESASEINGLNCELQQDFHDVLCLHKEPSRNGMEFAELIKTTRVDSVILRKQGGSLIEGTLCLASHHLIFSSRVSEKDELMVKFVSSLLNHSDLVVESIFSPPRYRFN